MPRNHKTTLIDRFKAEAQQYLVEVEQANDLDLWEEMVGKMLDVMLIYRRVQESPAPTTFTFSNGVTLDIDAMAAAHAVAEVFPDLDHDDEFPAFLMRGEKGAGWPSNSSPARTVKALTSRSSPEIGSTETALS